MVKLLKPSNQVVVWCREIHSHHIYLFSAWKELHSGLRNRRPSTLGDQLELPEVDQSFRTFFLQMTLSSLQCGYWLELIKQGLMEFCRVSWQRVSHDKSLVYLSPNVLEDVVITLSSRLGIPHTTNLGRYLGFFLLHGGRNTQNPKELLLKASRKLVGWKLQCLSKAGRITLASAILNSLAMFQMQLMKMSTEVHKGLDRLCRRCIWGEADDRRKLHLINWDTIC